MRQVINKLITEEDLYGAVDLGLLAGLAAGEAVLPHRAAHRDRRGHARHRRAGPDAASPSAAATPRARSVTVSVGGFVPKPSHAVPVVRPEHVDRAAAQDQPAARRRCGATAACSSSGTTPRPPWPRGSPAGAIAASGAVIEDVWRAGGTFQEWSEYFDLTAVGRRHGPPRPVDRLVRAPPPRPSDEVLPWDHISAGLHKDFLWQDWRDALDELGLPDCRWTPCYDCGACTGYGIEHVVASAVAPGGRQPGHRPGPGRAWPCRCLPVEPAGEGLMRVRLPVRQAGQGPLHQPSRHRPGRGSGRCAGPSCPWRSPRASHPAPRSTSGWPFPPAHESLAEYLDVDFRDEADRSTSTLWPSCSARCCPTASTWRPPWSSRRARPSLQEAVTSCSWTHRGARPATPGTGQAAVDAAAGGRRAHGHPPAQGPRRHRRHPPVHPRSLIREVGRCPHSAEAPIAPAGIELDAELGTQPRSLRPAELVAALGAGRRTRDGSAGTTMDQRSTAPGRSPCGRMRRRRRVRTPWWCTMRREHLHVRTGLRRPCRPPHPSPRRHRRAPSEPRRPADRLRRQADLRAAGRPSARGARPAADAAPGPAERAPTPPTAVRRGVAGRPQRASRRRRRPRRAAAGPARATSAGARPSRGGRAGRRGRPAADAGRNRGAAARAGRRRTAAGAEAAEQARPTRPRRRPPGAGDPAAAAAGRGRRERPGRARGGPAPSRASPAGRAAAHRAGRSGDGDPAAGGAVGAGRRSGAATRPVEAIAGRARRARRGDRSNGAAGAERKGRPVGPLPDVRVTSSPTAPRSPCSRAARSSSTTCRARPTTPTRSTATSTAAG